MQRRTVLFLSLLAGTIATAAGVWWLGGDGGVSPAPAPPNGANAPIAPRPEPPSQPTHGQDPPALPPGAPSVRVDVTAVETFVPPPPMRVQAVSAIDQRELPAVLVSGAGAGFDTSPHTAGAALCAIDVDGVRVLRQVALAGGEVTRLVVGGRVVCNGSVHDAAGKPVVGATVWLGELDVAGGRREVVTDEDGAFRLEASPGDGVPFVVRKAGFAANCQFVQIVMLGGALRATIEPACTLDVQLAGVAVDMTDARVFVVPGDSVSTGLSRWPFFAQALDDGYALDEAGRVSIDELPQLGDVGIVVSHPRALRGAPHAVKLKGERVRATVPLQTTASVRRGRVVDDTGAPLAGVLVWSRRPGRDLAAGSSQRLLPPHLDARGIALARTGADGTFTIAAVESRDAILSLRGIGYAGRDVVATAASADAPFVLPVWHGGEPEFRLLPPRAGVAWHAETDLAGGLREVVAADRPWRVSLPHAGRFQFVVTTSVNGEVRGTQRLDDVAVTGAVELVPPKPE